MPLPDASAAKGEGSWFSVLTMAMVLGAVALVIYSFKQQNSSQLLATAGLVALAALLSGAFAGFIFGIPKSAPKATADTSGGKAAAAVIDYEGNTNLEQISDWLTKILVGAGLVQLGEIGTFFDNLSARLKPQLGAAGGVVGPAIVILYSICGFLMAYLWARIYLARELEHADDDDHDHGEPEPAAAVATASADTATATS